MSEQKQKTNAEYFRDWEAQVFGYGYGTGEEHILPILRRFMECICVDNHNSDLKTYRSTKLAAELTPGVAWLMINALCRADILEYGTSPRNGGLTTTGKNLHQYVMSKTTDQLYEAVLPDNDEDYFECSHSSCNCGPRGYQKDVVCMNPFWVSLAKYVEEPNESTPV